ncbi:hypothetical protein ACEQPO_18380 [Bacillus sp. SL00103]
MNQLSSVAFLRVSKRFLCQRACKISCEHDFIWRHGLQRMANDDGHIIGSCAILLIIAGVVLTSLGQKNGGGNDGGNFKKGSSFCLFQRLYVGYVVI